MLLTPGEVSVINRDGIRFRANATGLHRNRRSEHQYRVQLPAIAPISMVVIWISETDLRFYCRTGKAIKLERCKNE